MKRISLSGILSALIVLVSLASCASTARVSVQNPSLWDTSGIKLLGIQTSVERGVGNETANEWESQIRQTVSGLGRYTVIDPGQTAYLLRLNSSLIGQMDAVLITSIDSFTVTDSVDSREVKDSEGNVTAIRYTYYRKARMVCTFALRNASNRAEIARESKTYESSESKSSTDELTPSNSIARSLISSKAMSDLRVLIAPYTTMVTLKFMKDKMKDPQMKLADEIFNNGRGNTREAVALWQRIYEHTGNVAAGYNAALGTRVAGDLPAAISMMQQVYSATGNADAATQVSQMQTALGKERAVALQTNSQSKLDKALSQAESGLKAAAPEHARVGFVNISQTEKDVVDLCIDEISLRLMNTGEITVVDRSQTSLLMEEQNFQLSGAVSDDTIVSIGHTLGANVLVVVSITGSGTLRRLNFRVLDVETSKVLDIISIEI